MNVKGIDTVAVDMTKFIRTGELNNDPINATSHMREWTG